MNIQRDISVSVDAAVSCILRGGVLIYPTETVYGIGGDPCKEDVVERIQEIKRREEKKGFLLLIPDTQVLDELVSEIPEVGQRLIEHFWPGPLTVVFRAASHLPIWMTGGHETIALRMSNDPVAMALVEALKRPLISTSANRSEYPPALSCDELDPVISGAVDLIIDGGRRCDPRPSTIVDVSSGEVRLIRAGQISEEEIYEYTESSMTATSRQHHE